MQINQQRASVARRGNGEQQKVFQQARLRVEGLPQVQHEISCNMLMAKVSETCGKSFHNYQLLIIDNFLNNKNFF